MSARRVVDLAEADREFLDVAGGKAVGLGRLLRLGLPVPPGFCVTAAAYRAHVTRPEVRPFLLAAAAASCPAPREEALAALRRAILELPVEEATREEVAAALESLAALAGRGPRDAHAVESAAPLRLAVRSSAAAEDLPGRSFAGQHRTVLGVEGLEGCLAAMRECWASLWSDGAVAYRERAGIAGEPAMAVVIQPLVDAEASGVLFTADPLTGRRDRVVIESVRGLGEALVSGRAAPDRIVLSRPGLEVIERAAATPSSGVVSLDDETARSLARLALRAEGALAAPADVEWAVEGGRIHLLQARPITALPTTAPADGQIWTNLNTCEILPDVVTPLTWSIVSVMARELLGRLFARAGLDIDGRPLVGRVAGRAYFNLNTIAACCRRVPGMGDKAIVKLFGGSRELEAALARLGPDDLPHVGFHPLRLAASAPGLAFAMLTFSGRGAERLIDWARRLLEEESRPAPEDLSGAELAARLGRCLDHFRLTNVAIDAFLPGQPWIVGLFECCRRWLAPDGEALAGRLVAGLATNEIAAAGLDLAKLARRARAAPELAHAVGKAQDAADLRTRAGAAPGGADFLAAWDSFLAEHGHHSHGELELANPRWSEEPAAVLGMLCASLAAPAGEDFLDRFGRLAGARAETEAEIRRRLGPVRRLLFRAVLRRARRAIPLRENMKNRLVRGLALLRALLLELGRRAAAGGILERGEDVFFLTVEEVHRLYAGRLPAEEIRPPVAARRAEHAAHAAGQPPPAVATASGGPALPPVATAGEAGLVGGALIGIGVHPGLVRGPARVILRDGEGELLPGEVLVAPFTDPGWTPYFLNAAAIVVDTGGVLSHGSIVAREYGIPTVVNVGPATRTFRTGQLLEVDGARGTVRAVE